jgi:hypothetical protein
LKAGKARKVTEGTKKMTEKQWKRGCKWLKKPSKSGSSQKLSKAAQKGNVILLMQA